jgi:cell division septal protein FtsQ
VVIAVAEREPVAVVPAAGDRYGLVDASGRVLDVASAPPPGLVALADLPPVGPPGSALAADAAQALIVARALPPALAARIARVAPAAGRPEEVELRLQPQGVVRVGPPLDLASKFSAVTTVLSQVDVRNLAVLDVRRPQSPVLTRREATTKVSTPRAG